MTNAIYAYRIPAIFNLAHTNIYDFVRWNTGSTKFIVWYESNIMHIVLSISYNFDEISPYAGYMVIRANYCYAYAWWEIIILAINTRYGFKVMGTKVKSTYNSIRSSSYAQVKVLQPLPLPTAAQRDVRHRVSLENRLITELL